MEQDRNSAGVSADECGVDNLQDEYGSLFGLPVHS
jgi:hypothetical protein